MAILHHEHQQEKYASFFLDALYCEEDGAARVSEEEEESSPSSSNNGGSRSFFPLLLEQDLFWEDDELLSLFSKEEDEFLTVTRREIHREAVEWMLNVNDRHGFTALTAVLSVNYLDRFLSSFGLQNNKPWLIQLVAVTCLSLAAKVEETHVPLLLDLQVEGARYVFEPKTIQRMELLVLSTLKWKMHPITPLSFLDHITRRLGLKTRLHWEFLKRCERLLLSVISDSRSVLYFPSVLATATMMHVIDQVETFNSVDCRSQLPGVLEMSKDKVNDCYKLVLDVSTRPENRDNAYDTFPFHCNQKRKLEASPSCSSPSGVIDADFSSDSSYQASIVGPPPPSEPPFKRKRGQEEGMRLASLNRVFVDIVGNGSRPS
ncbi:Cyclin-D3-1 [Hibiscus syriacus]|uniref:Cyclin-D3-1 n=1 Tax=Hibiscus syriacus TaxID=106335 RepID=A0A6A2X0N1_HIBSY|nr:cyclin-D3-1-like [Hibiscus syriacus]KAE8668122.1 Cyclin-D3-1 [Hibiscus syriacus]